MEVTPSEVVLTKTARLGSSVLQGEEREVQAQIYSLKMHRCNKKIRVSIHAHS